MSGVRELFDAEKLKQDAKALEGYRSLVNETTNLSETSKIFFSKLLNNLINFDLKINSQINPIAEVVVAQPQIEKADLKFLKKLNELQVLLNSKVNLMTKDVFPKYEALVSELRVDLNAFLHLRSEKQPIMTAALAHVQPLLQIVEQNKQDKLTLESKRNDLEIQSFQVSANGQPVSLFKLIEFYIDNQKLLLIHSTIFDETGKMSVYDSITNPATIAKTEANIHTAKGYITTFAQHKAARDQKIAELKAKQQHGQFKPMPGVHASNGAVAQLVQSVETLKI